MWNPIIQFLLNIKQLFSPIMSHNKNMLNKIEAEIKKNGIDPIKYFDKYYGIGNPIDGDIILRINSLRDEFCGTNSCKYSFYGSKKNKLKQEFFDAIDNLNTTLSLNLVNGEFWKPWNEPGWTEEKDKLAKDKINEVVRAISKFCDIHKKLITEVSKQSLSLLYNDIEKWLELQYKRIKKKLE